MKVSKLKTAILCGAVGVSTNMIISTVLAQIASQFPEVGTERVQLILTVQQCVSFIFTLAAGLLGRRIALKYILAAGTAFYIMAGLPFVLNGHIMFFFLSGVFAGAGQGLLLVGGTTAISIFFEGNERSRMFGYNAAIGDAGATALMTIAGFFALYQWKASFAAYFLLIPCFFIVLLLMPVNKISDSREERKAGKKKMPFGVYMIAGFDFFYLLSYFSFLTNISIYMEEKNLGNVSQAAAALSVVTIAGMAGGLVFHRIYRIFHYKIISVGCFLSAVGFLYTAFFPSGSSVLISAAVIGYGWSCVITGAGNLIAETAPKSLISSAQGINAGASAIGCMLSAPILNFLCGFVPRRDSSTMFIISMTLLFVFTGITFFWATYMRKLKSESENKQGAKVSLS